MSPARLRSLIHSVPSKSTSISLFNECLYLQSCFPNLSNSTQMIFITLVYTPGKNTCDIKYRHIARVCFSVLHMFRMCANAAVEEGCYEGLSSLCDDVIVQFLRMACINININMIVGQNAHPIATTPPDRSSSTPITKPISHQPYRDSRSDLVDSSRSPSRVPWVNCDTRSKPAVAIRAGKLMHPLINSPSQKRKRENVPHSTQVASTFPLGTRHTHVSATPYLPSSS